MTTATNFEITTRRVGTYLQVAMNDHDHDLGFMDKEEVKALSRELLAASIELEECADLMSDKS